MTKCKEGKYAMGPYREQASDNNMYRIDCGEIDWGFLMTVIARTTLTWRQIVHGNYGHMLDLHRREAGDSTLPRSSWKRK